MQLPFENVREQLLRAGIAPRHASRYVTELREHLADLAAQQRATGLDSRQAEERALALLGSDTQLAQAMIDKGAPRSLAARAPWSVFGVLPVVLLMAVIWVTSKSMMHVLWPLRGLSPSELPTGYLGLITTISFFTNYLLGPLLAAGCIAVALRQRVLSRWVWVGLVLIALVSGLVGFHMYSIPSADGARGATLMLFSVAGVVHEHGTADLASTLAVAALRAAVLFTMAAVAYRILQARLSSPTTH
jgi:hypothetical protein